MDPIGGHEELRQERSRAAARVSEVEASWRAANEEVATASTALAEAERAGAATGRHKAEQRLAEAKAKAAEPWAERVDGARRAVRDADSAVRAHVAANLAELVEEREAAGQTVADRINASAADLIAGHAELESVAAQIGQLISLVAPPGPLDVSRAHSEPVARAAAALVAAGGEQGPTLDRMRPPWDTLFGTAEALAVDDTVLA